MDGSAGRSSPLRMDRILWTDGIATSLVFLLCEYWRRPCLVMRCLRDEFSCDKFNCLCFYMSSKKMMAGPFAKAVGLVVMNSQ